MRVKYVGIDGKLGVMDGDVTIGNVYKVLEDSTQEGIAFPVMFIDDTGYKQSFNWDVLEIVDEVKEEMNFKKSDLKNGMVVEMRNEERFLVLDYTFVGDSWARKEGYDEQLKIYNGSNRFDIVKVYNVPKRLYNIKNLQTCSLDLLWERETEQQEDIEQDLALKELKELKETIEKASKQIDEIERNLKINKKFSQLC